MIIMYFSSPINIKNFHTLLRRNTKFIYLNSPPGWIDEKLLEKLLRMYQLFPPFLNGEISSVIQPKSLLN